MWWPFKRKPAPLPPINENWQIGDMAEAVGTVRDHPSGVVAIRPGQRFIVAGVGTGHIKPRDPEWFLKLVGHPGWSSAGAFRKILPIAQDRKVTRRAPIKEEA